MLPDENECNKKYPIVEVQWFDHESNGGPGWEELTEQLKWAAEPPAVATSVGYLIYSCPSYIVIADTIMMNEQCGCANKLLRSSIISERALDEGRPTINRTER